MAMNVHISFDIEGEPTDREAAILAALAGGEAGTTVVNNTVAAPAEPAPEAEKPKRTRRTKAQIKADEEAKAAEPEADKPAEKPEKAAPAAEEPEEAEDTAELRSKARKAAVAFLNNNGREALEEILKEFDAKRIPDVDDAKLDDFIAALEG